MDKIEIALRKTQDKNSPSARKGMEKMENQNPEEEAKVKLQESLEDLERKAPKAFDEVYKFGIWRRKK